jgi:hypothetical protein
VKNRISSISCIRFNHLLSPFDNVAIRRLVLACVNQGTFMQVSLAPNPNSTVMVTIGYSRGDATR